MEDTLCITEPLTKEDFRTFWHMFDNYIIELVHWDQVEDGMMEWLLSDAFRRDFHLRSRHAEGAPKIYLIFSRGVCIGFCICTMRGTRRRQCHIAGFFVRSSYRGRGLGSGAWRQIERSLARSGTSRFVVRRSWHSSQFWYMNGFRQTSDGYWEKRSRRLAGVHLF